MVPALQPTSSAQSNQVRTATRLVQVTSPEDVHRWRAGFVSAYREVFAQQPYNERFAAGEVEALWNELFDCNGSICVLAVTPEDRVVGFGMGLPLRHRADVTRALTGLLPTAHTFYLAELGVLPTHQGRGIGTALLRARLERIDPQVFRGILLRASDSRDSYQLYTNMGFEDTGVSMHVRHLRTNGKVSSDGRIFLHSELSQVRLDKPRPTP